MADKLGIGIGVLIAVLYFGLVGVSFVLKDHPNTGSRIYFTSPLGQRSVQVSACPQKGAKLQCVNPADNCTENPSPADLSKQVLIYDTLAIGQYCMPTNYDLFMEVIPVITLSLTQQMKINMLGALYYIPFTALCTAVIAIFILRMSSTHGLRVLQVAQIVPIVCCLLCGYAYTKKVSVGEDVENLKLLGDLKPLTEQHMIILINYEQSYLTNTVLQYVFLLLTGLFLLLILWKPLKTNIGNLGLQSASIPLQYNEYFTWIPWAVSGIITLLFTLLIITGMNIFGTLTILAIGGKILYGYLALVLMQAVQLFFVYCTRSVHPTDKYRTIAYEEFRANIKNTFGQIGQVFSLVAWQFLLSPMIAFYVIFSAVKPQSELRNKMKLYLEPLSVYTIHKFEDLSFYQGLQNQRLATAAERATLQQQQDHEWENEEFLEKEAHDINVTFARAVSFIVLTTLILFKIPFSISAIMMLLVFPIVYVFLRVLANGNIMQVKVNVSNNILQQFLQFRK